MKNPDVPYKRIHLKNCTVDVSQLIPLLDNPLVQAMESRRQLGTAPRVYPGATHSRLEHSLYALKIMMDLNGHLVPLGSLTGEEALLLEAYALTHDIGHGPFSHITDSLVDKGHNERALDLFEEFEDDAAACGCDPERLHALFEGTDPLVALVRATPFGADKLAYLALDSFCTRMDGMPALEPIIDYLDFRDGRLVLHAKQVESAISLIELYRRMYATVYYRTSVMIFERFLQRLIAMLLGRYGAPAEIDEATLVSMMDVSLLATMSVASNPDVRQGYKKYLSRDTPKKAVCFHPNPDIHLDSNKHLVRCRIEPDLLRDPRLTQPETLFELEGRIASLLGCPALSVLVAPAVSDRRYLPPKGIFIQTNGGIRRLEEVKRSQFEIWTATARDYMSLAVCADEPLRELAVQRAEGIGAIIYDLLGA